MKRQIVENYTFKGLGFDVVLPLAILKENARGVRFLDVNMEELKDRVAYQLMLYPYAYTGTHLNFVRNYLELSTIQMSEILEVAQQTITNWEKKKGKEDLGLSEKQRSKLLLKLQQYFFNKKEEQINDALLRSKAHHSEIHQEPLVVDELYRVS